MFPIHCLWTSAALAATLGTHADLRSRSPGALDGVAADVRITPMARLSVQTGFSARLSNVAWDRRHEDDWLRSSELGTLDASGSMPIAADVWSAEALVGVRALEGTLPVDIQAGWTLRGQSAAYLLQRDGSFTVRTDEWEGAVRLRPLNPLVGIGVGLQASKSFAVEVALQQVFPIQDSVLESNPGFTVVRVGTRMGRSRSAAAEGEDAGPPGIRVLGVPEADAVFARVDTILTELESLDVALETAHSRLVRVAQLKGMSVGDFIHEVRSGAIDLGYSVNVVDGRPQVTVKTGLQGELGEAAAAVQAVGDSATKVATAVPALLEATQELVDAARTLVEAGPKLVRDAGISPLQVPQVVGDLKHNLNVTAAVPKRLGTTLTAATELLASLGMP